MLYPRLPEQNWTRQMIDTFRGYNHNLRIDEGEFYDMQNMSSDLFPMLTPRKTRGTIAAPSHYGGMIAKDELCYVDSSDLVVGGQRIAMELTSETPKTLINMGAYVIILPDKKFVNTKPDINGVYDCGDIEASMTTTGAVTFTLCRLTGEAYDVTFIQADTPQNPENQQLWMDTSKTPNSLKQFSSATGAWIPIASTYIRISADNIGEQFNSYDAVSISGIVSEELKDLNTSMTIYDRGDNYITVAGILKETTVQTEPVTVRREMPTMDYVIESGNRLWGCRYGKAKNGEFVNEIYASKLGDFKNWSSFLGIATDSYVASVGTNGEFTGAVSHMGYPIFFKEGYMHKIYGNMPSQYQIQTTPCRGVQQGSHKSLAIVNEVLFYKSRLGVCAYDGSLPTEVSQALGDVAYFDAVGGAHGNKYYISMADKDNKYHLFVFDTTKGLWYREDNTRVLDFCSCRNEMYFFADDGELNLIKTVFGSGTRESDQINWYVESGVIGFDTPDKKYIANLAVRLKLEPGSRVYFYIEYDSKGMWEHIGTMSGHELKSINVPIRPHRCDHFRLKIAGEGYSTIYSICKTLEDGSEI